ncbi:MAG: catecholate siderophore receptor [Psychromonas sp.]|jgi:catecholate siderophore receptor|uniref:TonB-dependent receptor n=1 Tax=Psychromonas sp. TaxID=1884585 RepID=UPI0039E4D0EB
MSEVVTPEFRVSHHTHYDSEQINKNSSKSTNLFVSGSLALVISTALIADVKAEEVNLDALLVEDTSIAADANPYSEPGAPYKAKKLSDSKRSRDIADTPATVTVLTKEAIADSGKTELKDILSAQPGITLGTGEGGNSFGDRYVIRGYEARSDVFTDGLREPGLISRDTFALEQVEISKGPNSTFAGRGSTGGAVNSVTKKASLDDDFVNLSAGLGTDKFQRYTVDGNKVINDDLAVRLNLLYAEKDVPDRGPAGEQRIGALLSTVYQVTDDLKIAADYYHYQSDDTPDVGTYLVDGEPNGEQGYPGIKDLDFLRSQADTLTLTMAVDINDAVRLENKSRYGKTSNEYIMTTIRSDGQDRTFAGWQDNEYLGNQTNIIIDQEIAGRRHTIITGIELAQEKVQGATSAWAQRMAGGAYDIDFSTNTATKLGEATDYKLNTVSAYLMDTITLNEDWELFAGLRYDYFQYDLWLAASNGRGGPVPEKNYGYSDGFFNGHVGVVYSPWENGNIYANWSTSANINGGEADSAGNCGYGGICTDDEGNYKNAEPEESVNLELGTKWNLMDEQLLLSAAVFQITKDNVIEGGNDSYVTGGNLNTGKNRVEGIELGLSGNITSKLSGQFGIALMDSETLESFNADNVGNPKANFAKQSANLQLRYQVVPKLAVGGNATYSSEIYGGQPDAGASGNIRLDGYTVYDLFASYQFSEKLELRGNIQNLTDEDYYTAVYRGGDIVYIGDARSANLTLNYKF